MMTNDLFKKLHFTYSFMRKRMTHLNLQLLYQCNFKCTICDFWKEPFKSAPSLSLEQIEVIAEKLKSIKPLVISIGGGEPLLHKELLPITKVLARDHFPVMICNGWYVTPENARALWEAGMHEISISVDYSTPEKHDAQRGLPGAHARAVNALKILHETRMRSDQRVHMISVIMDDNIHEVEELIKLSKSMGITYLITFYSNYRGKKPSLAQQKNLSSHLLELKKKYPEFVALPEFITKIAEAQVNPKGISPCYAGKNLFNIDSQGNVTRCIDRLDDSVGNILTEDLNPILEKLYMQHRNSDCGDCWTSCRGSIESLMYGRNKLVNYKAYYTMIKDVALVKPKTAVNTN